ncbi:unnamed protein product [Phytophthora fragariaefolia]|uniref:Unnamed protein product n=1 Tax=Phytophthora fragariaefolia TaxID=1490495 RepID=A0A9W6XCZ0_9STRA|nr:unnamed protein product [Phytophthora fragariaefolia]
MNLNYYPATCGNNYSTPFTGNKATCSGEYHPIINCSRLGTVRGHEGPSHWSYNNQETEFQLTTSSHPRIYNRVQVQLDSPRSLCLSAIRARTSSVNVTDSFRCTR